MVLADNLYFLYAIEVSGSDFCPSKIWGKCEEKTCEDFSIICILFHQVWEPDKLIFNAASEPPVIIFKKFQCLQTCVFHTNFAIEKEEGQGDIWF